MFELYFFVDQNMVPESKNKMETKIHQRFGAFGPTILFSNGIWTFNSQTYVCWR